MLKFDQPWEGLYCGYETVLKDGDLFRFYYRGMPVARHTLDVEVTCVAESRDGIQWTRPKLGLFEVQGTKDNNVVLARHRGCHNFAPFIDANPPPADQQYKALGRTGAPGLTAFASPGGISHRVEKCRAMLRACSVSITPRSQAPLTNALPRSSASRPVRAIKDGSLASAFSVRCHGSSVSPLRLHRPGAGSRSMPEWSARTRKRRLQMASVWASLVVWPPVWM